MTLCKWQIYKRDILIDLCRDLETTDIPMDHLHPVIVW